MEHTQPTGDVRDGGFGRLTTHDRSDGAGAGGGTRPLTDKVDAASVVVVDDHPANVALLKRIIHEAGIASVHGVVDSRQAVERCLAVDADLVLLDLQMPYKDGFAVMSELRERLPDDTFMPVLVLTADTTTATRNRALSAGAKDFLTKPFDRAEVVLRVRNLLETRALYTDLQHHNERIQADLDQRLADERLVLEARRQRIERIDDVLSGTQLAMVFQPIADLEGNQIVGVEALARFRCAPWRPPYEWFDEATSVGRGPQLELAAIAAAFTQLDRIPPHVFLSVNVSPTTATLPELEHLLEAVPPDRIVLEVTEHTQIADYDSLIAALTPLRRRGVRIAVDDAGAGYSSLRHVLRLRPDILKLDIGLIQDIHDDPAKRALSLALVAFAREISAVLVAEGVETAEELATLRLLKVPWGQGYHLARPGVLPLATSHLHPLLSTV